jgi:isoamylase
MLNRLPGSPHPLGATWDGEGVNFALYSETATGVELCLFDADGRETRVPVPNRTAYVWHVYLPNVGPGQRYGYRVDGPYDPEKGLRFNRNVVLLDPYARALDGRERWEEGCFAYPLGDPKGDLRPSSSPQLGVPRGLVIDPEFDWEGDAPLQTPLHRTVLYEAHVRGLTMRHPEVPPAIRGTYAGVAHPAVIRYLRDLGVTAIELMPVHAFIDDKILLDKGLRNYWGYNTIGFFAPDVRYRSGSELGGEVREFKQMVKALHRAGIEVILDVVYNHTAEGNHLGPTFHFKGIDNATYYRLVARDPRFYFDTTGTGNTLNVRHPQALALIMDSLRYWASEMHVDGFRFDLASSLARQLHEVDQLSSFFALIHQAPRLRHAKIIAEPWDVGDGGYQVGNFPVRWAEWNGRYRDAVRALWRGDGGQAAEIGYRLTGSSDLYESSGRRPSASINLLTAHDGFTLADLVSYSKKHNQANGEDGRDGSDNEHAWNCGVEGATTDVEIRELRARQQRNLLATLLLSQGTPMLLGGDEFGRTQGGNNNAYCQDNEVSWLDWSWSEGQRSLFEFTRRMLRLRRAHPALRRSKFFQGRAIHSEQPHDIAWFRHDGKRMSAADWDNHHTKSIGMFLAGRGIDDVDEEGRPIFDDDLLILINASDVDMDFDVPPPDDARERWHLLVDTADDEAEESVGAREATTLIGRSMKFFRAPSRVLRTGGASHTLGATYRLQLGPGFGFREAMGVIDYLCALGVTDVYASPLLAAARGSTHGYDVIDHGRLNEALGADEDFVSWTDELRARGLGLLLDWVPNHMGIAGGQNRAWDDVLENGPSSTYAEYFDVDWSPPKMGLEDRVLLPILGGQYGEALERGELRVVWEDGVFRLAFHEHRLPLGPKTLMPVVASVIAASGLPEGHADREELESILAAMRNLPERHERAADQRKERAREKEIIKRRLKRLVLDSEAVAKAVGEALVALNGTPGSSSTFDALDALLGAQTYRLASWQVAAEEINYRRFFDINELAAIRMESAPVFEQAHALLFQMLREGRVSALRLDHTDGLYDPLAYFEALQRRFVPPTPRATPGSPDDLARPLPLLVEKILEPGEKLPASWPIDGTTGYEFTAAVLGLWVDPRAEEPMTLFWHRFSGDHRTLAEHIYEAKHHILRYSLASEVNMLARALERIASRNRRWRDFTLISLARALTETLAAFSVYRTYLREGRRPSEQDERRIRDAIRAARRNNPSMSPTVFAFLEEVLLLRTDETEEERLEHERFALRFQQLTGPVMAKSVEDTTFYRYHRLVCLNEVGGHPGAFGTSVEDFHRLNAERARDWPLSMTTTSTHDTKRGEDTAARIAVLSEMPHAWRSAVRRWSELAEGARAVVDGAPAPSRALEYLFYQTVVGAWPLGWDGTGPTRAELEERLGAYLLKAAKEAKQQTSWTTPNPAYDEAVGTFVKAMLSDDAFIADLRELCELIGPHGAINGLAQTLLRLCSPGVPDTYQGAELWNQSLVDPDNRRPVDFGRRKAMLARITEARARDPLALARELLASYEDGAIKLYVTHVALLARRARRELFLRGDYEDLPGGDHAVAFTRSHGDERLVCCVPRLTLARWRGEGGFPLGSTWGDERIRLPYAGRYRDALTGAAIDVAGDVRLAEVFAHLPVALLFLEQRKSKKS